MRIQDAAPEIMKQELKHILCASRLVSFTHVPRWESSPYWQTDLYSCCLLRDLRHPTSPLRALQGRSMRRFRKEYEFKKNSLKTFHSSQSIGESAEEIAP
jgi:hypothetical protein